MSNLKKLSLKSTTNPTLTHQPIKQFTSSQNPSLNVDRQIFERQLLIKSSNNPISTSHIGHKSSQSTRNSHQPQVQHIYVQNNNPSVINRTEARKPNHYTKSVTSQHYNKIPNQEENFFTKRRSTIEKKRPNFESRTSSVPRIAQTFYDNPQQSCVRNDVGSEYYISAPKRQSNINVTKRNPFENRRNSSVIIEKRPFPEDRESTIMTAKFSQAKKDTNQSSIQTSHKKENLNTYLRNSSHYVKNDFQSKNSERMNTQQSEYYEQKVASTRPTVSNKSSIIVPKNVPSQVQKKYTNSVVVHATNQNRNVDNARFFNNENIKKSQQKNKSLSIGLNYITSDQINKSSKEKYTSETERVRKNDQSSLVSRNPDLKSSVNEFHNSGNTSRKVITDKSNLAFSRKLEDSIIQSSSKLYSDRSVANVGQKRIIGKRNTDKNLNGSSPNHLGKFKPVQPMSVVSEDVGSDFFDKQIKKLDKNFSETIPINTSYYMTERTNHPSSINSSIMRFKTKGDEDDPNDLRKFYVNKLTKTTSEYVGNKSNSHSYFAQKLVTNKKYGANSPKSVVNSTNFGLSKILADKIPEPVSDLNTITKKFKTEFDSKPEDNKIIEITDSNCSLSKKDSYDFEVLGKKDLLDNEKNSKKSETISPEKTVTVIEKKQTKENYETSPSIYSKDEFEALSPFTNLEPTRIESINAKDLALITEDNDDTVRSRNDWMNQAEVVFSECEAEPYKSDLQSSVNLHDYDDQVLIDSNLGEDDNKLFAKKSNFLDSSGKDFENNEYERMKQLSDKLEANNLINLSFLSKEKKDLGNHS